MHRALAILLTLASCGGCASKPSPPPTTPPQPSLARRLFGSLPHPGDGAAPRHVVDDDKRDKDNDF